LDYDAAIRLIVSPLEKAAMLKGLIICFAVMFAQLAVLHVIDVRLYNAPQDARQVASTTTPPHKNDEKDSQG